MKKYIFILFSLIPFLALAQEKTDPPNPDTIDRFETLFPIIKNGPDALQQVWLIEQVYQSFKTGDCHDLRVFNSKNESLPFVVEKVSPQTFKEDQWSETSFYPLYGQNSDSVHDLKIVPRRDSTGRIVDIDSVPLSGKGKNTGQLLGYLLDTHLDKQKKLGALRFYWKNNDSFFISTLTIEASNDLKSWRYITRDGILSNLSYKGSVLKRDIIDLLGIHEQFIRITWGEDFSGLSLTRVSSLISSSGQDKSLEMKNNFSFKPLSGSEESYLSDTGGFYPISTLDILLMQSNTVASITLTVANSEDGPWRQVFSGTVFNIIQSGKQLTQGPLPVFLSGGRYFKLTVNANNPSLGIPPELAISWKPEKLVFVSQGDPPFTLAVGNSDASPYDENNRNLVNTVRQINKKSPQSTSAPAEASIAEPTKKVVGPLPKYKKPIDKRAWILWSILGGGVLLLSLLAMSLMKEVKQKT